MKKLFEMIGINPAMHTVSEAMELFSVSGAASMLVMPKDADEKPLGLLLVCGPEHAEEISRFVRSLEDA